MPSSVAEKLPVPMRARRRWRVSRIRLIAVAAGLVLWELLGRAHVSLIIPSVTDAVVALAAMIQKGELQRNLAISLVSFGIGFGLAVVSGVLLGALMARYPAVEYFFDLYVTAGMSSPTLAFLPILIILFGMNESVRIAVAWIFSFWVIVVNTFTGIKGADRNLVEMARSFGATEAQLFWRIQLPSGMALIMSGIRLGAGRAVKGMVNGEMLITIVGIGAMIMTYAGSFRGPELFAVLIAICLMAIVFDRAIRWLQRSLAPWSVRR